MTDYLAFVFWALAALILYTYVGFPLTLLCVGAARRHGVQKRPITPNISLIIAAYNEQQSIAQKLNNSLDLDYPHDALEIIVASDGSNDDTESIVRGFSQHGVKLLSLERKGKIFALNEAVSQSNGDVLVFSDANTLYDPEALRKLARNFADPEVGGVCGNQIHLKQEQEHGASKGEKSYWAVDKWLKEMETLTGSIVSADGAIYAIRRELYRAPASASVTDDFAISTAVVEQGYRLVFEREAIAYETTMPNAEREFARKVRIMNRGLRGVILRRRLLNPLRYGFYSLTLFCHKVLRRLVPFFLLAIFVINILLLDHGIYATTAVVQVTFYGWAGISYLLRNTHYARSKIIYIPFFYCLANLAAAVAVFKLMSGKRIELWQPQR